MTTCNTCSNAIPDPAEEWPDGNSGTIYQECWETESSRMWWAAVIPLDRADALGGEWDGGVGAAMIPEPLAWFSIGALFGLVLCGWPWHHRFSRYRRSNRYRADADSNGNCVPLPPAPPGPEFYKRRKPPTQPQP